MSEKTINKIPNVPNLRFKNETWIQCIISDVCAVIGGGTPSTAEPSFWDGEYQWFTPSEIGKSKYVSNSLRTITKEGLNKSSAKLLPAGTVLLTTRATIGDVSISTTECCTNQGFQSLIVNENADNEFIYYLIQTKIVELKAKSNGSTFIEISNSEMKAIKIFVPCFDTQHRIAAFLSLIDQRIQTQSKIIEEYKLLKNSFINQLIFNNIKLNQHVKLSDFAVLKNGYAFKNESYTDDGKFNIITIANVQGDRYISISSCNKIHQIPKDIQPHQILDIGDILISLTGNVGRVSLVNISNCLLNQRVGVLKFKINNFKKYIFQVISNKVFENKMILKGQGAAQKNVGNDDIESFLIPFSQDISYINKIVKLLECFDEKIAIEKQILNDYLSQKKYLLANMFI